MPVSRASCPLKMAVDHGSVKVRRSMAHDGLEVGELHVAHDVLAARYVRHGLEAHAGPSACQRAASGARP